MVKRRVANQTGCPGDVEADDIAPCLRLKSVEELLAVQLDPPRFTSGFAPFIDGTVLPPTVNQVIDRPTRRASERALRQSSALFDNLEAERKGAETLARTLYERCRALYCSGFSAPLTLITVG